MYVYVDSVVMPGIGTDGIGYEGRKQPVEIEEEEESAITSNGAWSEIPVSILFVEVIQNVQNSAHNQLNKEDPVSTIISNKPATLAGDQRTS